MPGKVVTRLAATAAVLLVALALVSPTSFAQAGESVQIASNEIHVARIDVDSPKVPKAHEGLSLSPVELRDRIEAQQEEIDELRSEVTKLQAMLQPAASSPRSLAASSAPAASPSPALPIPHPETIVMGFVQPRELLPDIGQIGAQVGLLVGGSQNPFKASNGFFAGGFIDLPVKKVKGGKLSYEILVSAQRTTTTVQTTSGVNALVNGLVNVELGTAPAVANLFSPLPVTSQVRERSTVLTVAPVEFKYTVTALDHHRIRPYLVAGLGTYVGLSTQNNTKSFDATAVLGNTPVAALLNSILQGPQVAGLAPAAPELRARGVSQGQGDLRFGLQYGGGMEFRATPKLSFGFDYRRNKVEGTNAGFSSFTFNQGIHF